MDKAQISSIVLGMVGTLLLAFGYQIKFNTHIHLVAGVYKNEDNIKDKKAFASFVGWNVIILGLIFCAGAVGIYVRPSYKEFIESIVVLSLLVTGIVLYSRRNKYTL